MNFLTNTVSTISWLDVVNLGVKSTIVCLLTWLAVSLMKRSAARRRHQVHTLGFALLIVVPAIGIVFPVWKLGWVPNQSSSAGLATKSKKTTASVAAPTKNWPVTESTLSKDFDQQETQSLPIGHDDSMLANSHGPSNPVDGQFVFPGDSGMASHSPPKSLRAPTAAEINRSEKKSTASDGPRVTMSDWAIGSVISIWLLGAFLFAIRWLAGCWQAIQVRHRSEKIASTHPMYDLFEEIKCQSGYDRQVGFRRVKGDRIPMVTGLISPTILVPEAFEVWPKSQQRSVLAHEYGHVIRGDLWSDALARLAVLIYWWNPVAWRLKRLHESEREKACDELVVSMEVESTDYAQDLVAVVRKTTLVSQPAAIAMARNSMLKERVENILNFVPETAQGKKLAVVWFSMVLLLSGLVLPFAVGNQPEVPSGLAQSELMGPSYLSGTELTSRAVPVEGDTQGPSSIEEPKLVASERGGQESDKQETDETPSEQTASRAALKAQVAKERAERLENRKEYYRNRDGEALVRKVTASGKVLDANGKPARGVKVMLREFVSNRITEDSNLYGYARGNWDKRRTFTFAEVMTDDEGRFAFDDVPSRATYQYKMSSSNWSVVAVNERGTIAAWQPLISNNQRELKLKLCRYASLTGRVVDQQGNPIPDVEIHANLLMPVGRPLTMSSKDREDLISLANGDISPRAKTDQQGRFVMSDVPERTCVQLRPRHPDFLMPYFVFAATTKEPQPNLKNPREPEETYPVQTGEISIALKRGRSIVAKVLDIHGHPLVNSPATLSYSSTNAITQGYTDLDGYLSFKQVPNETVFLRLFADRKKGNRSFNPVEKISFGPNEYKKEMTIRFREPAVIKGRVMAGSKPAAKIQVSFVPLDQPMLPNTAVVNSAETNETEPTSCFCRQKPLDSLFPPPATALEFRSTYVNRPTFGTLPMEWTLRGATARKSMNYPTPRRL